MRLAPLAAALLALAGCAEFEQAPGVIAYPSGDWRTVVTDSDRARLRDWRTSFIDALRAARADGHAADVEREGALLQPDAALGGGSIPNGIYHCRVLKVGPKTVGMLSYVSYPAFNCRIQQEGKLQGFAKLTGSQRQVGSIFPGDALRQVFLGTLVLGDEPRAYKYGRDTQRDIAGYVERIGPNRWRLIMPRPHFESQMDVMELVPAS
ncbi:MAG TPA: DUF4893 domain-containing protein [Sphingomicrobium sp.]|nr:DUF4893 domain-containing protein [Sphingomicrobium sp.]